MALDTGTAIVSATRSAPAASPALGGAARAAGAAAPSGAQQRPRRRFSPLTLRILAVNVLALALLGIGLLFLGEYESSLIDTELLALKTQGEIFAAALGEGAVIDSVAEGEELIPELGRQMMRRLVEPTRTRARLFDASGNLVADSRVLSGPGGIVQIRELPPPEARGLFGRIADKLYDWIVGRLPSHAEWPEYRDSPTTKAADYPEVGRALAGDSAKAVRRDRGTGGLQLSVAVPVQRYKQVLGAVLLSVGSGDLERAVRAVRLDILKAFLFALCVTVLLSIYLAGTIARPVRRLATAADRVRRGLGREVVIPDFSRRGDEIGDLSSALREMTGVLWQRMDAIDRFAADVAHEIKNPLTSLRSAVETASRIEDPVKQRRLLAIILEDVQRLDRLISDISDASRLDAELSRHEHEPVALDRMLATLVELHEATATEGAPHLRLMIPGNARPSDFVVPGIEDRLVQVLRNLIANAISFSPPGGTIGLAVQRDQNTVVVTVDDEGPGIPDAKLAAIFDRFYSERPAGEKFGTHSGLGLSISKQIIEAHRGVIRAENRHAAGGAIIGARFIVRLPAA
ncbi:MAG TPA: stimulus-sensing domain-containing protein [Stellaceae bacterium]|jgi:two-component system sensor histidine kinase ChvG|nr:stimulus-sensing domain-containing protein [Stellaceae bacterium]